MTITEQLYEALSDLYDMCLCNGNFRNGVTDATGTIDEGEVMAGDYLDKARSALAAYEAQPAYRCPVCGVANENAYIRCNQPDCPDGRDRKLQRCYMANCDHICAGDVRTQPIISSSPGEVYIPPSPKNND